MDLTATVVASVGLAGIVFSILGDEVQRDWMRLLVGLTGALMLAGGIYSLPLSGTPALGIGCLCAGGDGCNGRPRCSPRRNCNLRRRDRRVRGVLLCATDADPSVAGAPGIGHPCRRSFEPVKASP